MTSWTDFAAEDTPQDEPSSWVGDAKIAGRATEVSDRTRAMRPTGSRSMFSRSSTPQSARQQITS